MQSNLSKTLPWKKADYARVAAVFISSAAVIGLIFLAAVYLNSPLSFAAHIRENVRRLMYLMLMVLLVCASVFVYFYFEHKDFILRLKNIVLIFSVIGTGLISSYVFGRYINIYMRPLALCALLALLLIGRREAVFINFVQCILIFLMDNFTNANYRFSGYNYSSLIIGFAAGMTAIYAVSGSRSRFQVMLYSFVISLPIILICAFLEMAAEGGSIFRAVFFGFNSGIASAILFLALLPLFEILFNSVTDYRLFELTDHNGKLLKMFRQAAPGTFNHCVIVANLAEVCATAIGENPNLARAAAYYHDIGKITNPEAFAENTTGGNSPHDEYTPELSTDIIRSHAQGGYDIIMRNRLPEVLADVCIQHHGTMPIKFFYAKAKKLTEGSLDIDVFSYTGPKPQTKISAIIMLADACEAKVRTLAARAAENVEKAVFEIFDERMEMEQFNECEITMFELELIRKSIVTALTGIYHDRIKYPRLKIKRKN